MFLNSGIADAGDVLNVDDSGVVNITSTSIGTSTISTITGLGNPTNLVHRLTLKQHNYQ